jgi:hypothetical protein
MGAPAAFAAATLTLTLIGGVPAPSPAASSGGVSIRLTPSGPTEVGQGLPFAFEAIARNRTGEPATVDVALDVGPRHRAAPTVRFADWLVTVPANGIARSAYAPVTSQWFAKRGIFQITARAQGTAITLHLPFEVLPPERRPAIFEDVSERAGISSSLRTTGCGRWASGAAWGDANGDGLLDLYVPQQESPAQLWIQGPMGRFTDQAAARGVEDAGAIGAGATFADYDNDGDQDLYVVNQGPDRLYRNDGTGHFTDVTSEAGLGDPGVGPSASFGDYDGDGFLDLYVADHSWCGDGRFIVYQPDHLYHNEGDGTFTDVTDLLGPDATMGAGFQATWFDFDHDGDQDLYLANDYYGDDPDANHLWRNDGPDGQGGWRFTDVSAASGTGLAINSMGVAVGDEDGDGNLDLAISNIGTNVLLRGDGAGTFIDRAAALGAARPFQTATDQSVTWGLAFQDLNLDGWEDLYVASGSLGGTEPQPNEVFVNRGDGRGFLDLSAVSGADDPGSSRGVAFADFDRDGRVDVFVVDQVGHPRLYRNVTPTSGMHWLEVQTGGTASNRDGCGARITATIGDRRVVREVFCGSVGLASGSDRTVHLGLGTATTVDRLEIEWPSGTVQQLQDVAVDQLETVVEP